MKNNDKDLKLIYIQKVGHNTKGEGLYEFIFSIDPTNIDIKEWCWDLSPACDNVLPPTENYINLTIPLKTKTFDLFCLHESVECEYMHGYYTIHALAYEIEKEESMENGFFEYENLFGNNMDDVPLLVFHYGMSLEQIKDMFYARKIVFKNNELVDVSSIKIC